MSVAFSPDGKTLVSGSGDFAKTGEITLPVTVVVGFDDYRGQKSG
jgi:hypothetical protein